MIMIIITSFFDRLETSLADFVKKRPVSSHFSTSRDLCHFPFPVYHLLPWYCKVGEDLLRRIGRIYCNRTFFSATIGLDSNTKTSVMRDAVPLSFLQNIGGMKEYFNDFRLQPMRWSNLQKSTISHPSSRYFTARFSFSFVSSSTSKVHGCW